jgi:putative phosphotransacetylase
MNTSVRPDSSLATRTRLPVAIAERHVHLAPHVIEQLFCDRYKLHKHAPTSQPTEFAAEETVTLVGPQGRIPNVRVIGPPRDDNQIEISRTDARVLGIRAPVRRSGDLADTPGILVEGPRSAVRLDHGVIRALRHIHMHDAEASRFGIKDGDRVDVAHDDPVPRIIFSDVLVRVSSVFRSELQLDSEEAKAAELSTGDYVAILTKA